MSYALILIKGNGSEIVEQLQSCELYARERCINVTGFVDTYKDALAEASTGYFDALLVANKAIIAEDKEKYKECAAAFKRVGVKIISVSK